MSKYKKALERIIICCEATTPTGEVRGGTNVMNAVIGDIHNIATKALAADKTAVPKYKKPKKNIFLEWTDAIQSI